MDIIFIKIIFGNSGPAGRGMATDMKKAQAPQACLGDILDGWGTFWTKIYSVLSHFTVCRKLLIFHKVFRVKMGTLSPKKGVMTH